MQLEDMILISVDDHVVEPPDMWEGRVPKKYADQVPKIVPLDDGTEAWEFDGKRSTNTGLNAVAGRPPEDYGLDAQAFEDMRPGCYDVHRARPRHERQWGPGVVELPVVGGVRRRPVPADARQGSRPRHAPGLQRLARRGLVSARTPTGSSR